MNLIAGILAILFGVLAILQPRRSQEMNTALLEPLRDTPLFGWLYRYFASRFFLLAHWVIGCVFLVVGIVVLVGGLLACFRP